MERSREFHEKRIQQTYGGEHNAQAYREAHGEVSPGLIDLVNSGRLRPGSSILDLGCGPGVDAKYLRGNGFFVTAVDLFEPMVNIARREYLEENGNRGHFAIANIRHLPFADNSFDVVNANYVFPYLLSKAELHEATSECNRVLRDGGVFSVGVQEGRSGIRTVNASFGAPHKTSINVISRTEMRNLLETEGFVIDEEVLRKPKSHQTRFNKLVVYAHK